MQKPPRSSIPFCGSCLLPPLLCPPPPPQISGGAGGPAGGVPTGPAAVSVPSRRPRPLRADLTRAAASRRYKQRPRGEEGNRRPGSYRRSSPPDPPTADPESPDRSPGSRTGPRSSCQAGNHSRSLLPAGGVRGPGKGGALPSLQCAPRRAAALDLGARPGGALRLHPRVFHGAGPGLAVPPACTSGLEPRIAGRFAFHRCRASPSCRSAPGCRGRAGQSGHRRGEPGS